jgi:type I restriction enzyme S subunit
MTTRRFKKVASFSKVRRGASPRPIDDPKYFGGDVGWVRIADVTASKKYLRKTTQYVSELGEQNSVRVDKGDLIMSICGTIGRPVIVDMPACIHDGFVQLYDIEDSDTEFLYYSLQFSEEALKAQGQSGTQTNLNTSIVGGLEIFHPTHEEQTSIAAVLSSIDRAIEQTEALIAKQQRIKTGLMQDLLTKGIDEHGNIRSEATHEFKDSPLGRIPKEWDVARLGEVKNLITSGPRGWAKYYSDVGSLFLRIGNLTREHINLRLDNLIQVNPPETSEGIRTALVKDDVLISITADLGIVGVIPPDFGEAFVNQHIALVRLDGEKIFPRWVAHYLSSYAGQYQFQKLNESGAKAGLNLPTVNQLWVAKPKNRDEQQFIAAAIDRCVEAIDAEQKRLTKYQSLKRGLMRDLLTGEVSVGSLLAEQAAAEA